MLSFALILHLSSDCMALLITDSSVSEAIPLSLPARLSPYFCSSIFLSPRLLSAAPSLPSFLSPLPTGMCGVGPCSFH